MPLNRWNKSVLRYYFCRFLATNRPEVQQFVECDRIDLVLQKEMLCAFVEFKLYLKSPRFDPYDHNACGFKGGPSKQNLREFESCIDALHQRRCMTGLSKYIILVYADSIESPARWQTFSRYYDSYQHPNKAVSLRLVDSIGPTEVNRSILKAQLYEVECKS